MVREHIEREIKVETLRRLVIECSKEHLPALKTQLIAFAGKEWGTERRKCLEYLNQLIAESSIFIEGENVWSLKNWLKIEKARNQDYLKMEDIFKGFHQKKL